MVTAAKNNIVIVDTNIFSYWFKGDTRGKPYLQYAIGHQLVLSFATKGELYYWAMNSRWGPLLMRKLKETIAEHPILNSNDAICQKFAQVRMQLKDEPISYDDYWIAACALKFDCPILTNDVKHFFRIKGVKLLGPYSN